MSEMVKDVEEILLKTVGGITSLYLQECYARNEKPIFNKINEKVTEKPKTYFNFTPDYVYMNIEYQYENDIELKSVLFMFEQYLKKNTTAVEHGLKKAYFLTANLFKVENGIAYSIECKNPIFVFKQGSRAVFIFKSDDVQFSKFNVSEEEIDLEVEQEMREREEVLAKEDAYLNSDSDVD